MGPSDSERRPVAAQLSGNSITDSHRNPHRDGDSNSNAHRNSYCHGHGNCNTYINRNAYSNSYSQSNAQHYSHFEPHSDTRRMRLRTGLLEEP